MVSEASGGIPPFAIVTSGADEAAAGGGVGSTSISGTAVGVVSVPEWTEREVAARRTIIRSPYLSPTGASESRLTGNDE